MSSQQWWPCFCNRCKCIWNYWCWLAKHYCCLKKCKFWVAIGKYPKLYEYFKNDEEVK